MSLCVVDTVVMQSANAPLDTAPTEGRTIVRRLELLRRISRGEIQLLWSKRLLKEWADHVPEPRNDFVRAVLELLTNGHGQHNWRTPWTGGIRADIAECRYPGHDSHLLRTAILDDDRSYLVTEENRLSTCRACVSRKFNVSIRLIEEADQIPAGNYVR
jgi:hypothetical protein